MSIWLTNDANVIEFSVAKITIPTNMFNIVINVKGD